MLDKNFIQSFLKVNDAPEHMSDSDVKALLSRAGWTQTEVDAALAVLKGGASIGAGSTPQFAGGPVYQPVNEFSSQQLSKLLGVDVEVDPGKVRRAGVYSTLDDDAPLRPRDAVMNSTLTIAAVFLSVAVTAVLGFMFLYLFGIGPFGD